MSDLISRADALAIATEEGAYGYISAEELAKLPSAQSKQGEVIPHRNYKYLSDYWCDCGWHLGKKNDVNYCANCGKRVLWDEQTERSE